MSITVNYYDKSATKIVRTRAYSTRKLADAAMARARAKGIVSAIAGKRAASDQPTVHH